MSPQEQKNREEREALEEAWQRAREEELSRHQEGQESKDASSGGDQNAEADASDGEVVEVSMDQLLQTFKELEPKLRRAEEALQRERADFVNYRRRMERRVEELREEVRRELLAGLFPFLDTFYSAERGLETHEHFEGLKDAFEVLRKELHRVLEEWNVKIIGDTEVQFDPDRHEVVFTKPAEETGKPVVDEVIRPGYAQQDRVLRTAQVVVRQPASPDRTE